MCYTLDEIRDAVSSVAVEYNSAAASLCSGATPKAQQMMTLTWTFSSLFPLRW